MRELKHIVLIGLNFQPNRSTGDKNFWVSLVPLLASRLEQITILSIRDHEGPNEEIIIGKCKVSIRYLRPRFLESSSSTKRKRFFWRSGKFPSILGIIEKALNTRRILSELGSISRTSPYQFVHLMDNLGFANSQIARHAGSPVSVSAMAYQAKRPTWVYIRYLILSYKHKNLVVVPYSLAFSAVLTDIGIPTENVRRIHWGIATDSKHNDNLSRRAKESLGFSPDRPLILWSGYIQQIGREDFYLAYDMARKTIARGFDAQFYFAFKPESFEKGFSDLELTDDSIFVSKTTVEQFSLLLDAADVFFSPVANTDCVVAPPLTWIEIMGRGTPILTTPVRGADEIICHGKTGFIADSSDASELLNELAKQAGELRMMCRTKIHECYNLKDSASEYIDLWQTFGATGDSHASAI